jgi:two-component system cell cycle sensor histidine kinase/response regulator CckA
LLTDLVMPHISGVELAQRIGRTRPGVAVLFMSGYSQDVLGPRRALDDGVALIQQPFAAEELLKSVRAVIAAASQNKDQANGPTGQPAAAS